MFRFQTLFGGHQIRSRRPAYHSEVLEDRCLLTTFVVNSPDDVDNGDDPGVSLREAIRRANENPGEDTIHFDIPEMDILGNLLETRIFPTSPFTISDDLTIEGYAEIRNTTTQALFVEEGVTAVLSNLLLRGGGSQTDPGMGGAINNAGNLTLMQVSVYGQQINGGGIYNSGNLFIESSFVNGEAFQEEGDPFAKGGGIFHADGSLTILNSRVGGGAYSSVSNENADGGAIYINGGVVTLRNITIRSGNTTGTAGAMFINDTNSPDVSMFNSLMVGNRANFDERGDIAGTLNPASSFNLISDPNSAGGLTDGVNNNIVGKPGGGLWEIDDVYNRVSFSPTRFEVKVTSPTINAGSNALVMGTMDSAGNPRVIDGNVDIGSREYVPYNDTLGFDEITGKLYLSVSDGESIQTRDLNFRLSTDVTWDFHRGDVNGDGIDDLIGRQQETGQWWGVIFNPISVPNGNFQGPQGEQPELVSLGKWGTDATAGWQHVQVGDINNDGKADIVGMTNTGQWWAAVSDGTRFTNQYLGKWNPTGWAKVNFADVNNDGNDDLLGFHTPTGQWWVGLSNGTSLTTTYAGRWQQDAGWNNFLSGDFNGDGNGDLIAQTATGYWYIASLNSSQMLTTTFAGRSTTAHPTGLPAVGDFDGDGRSDLLLESMGSLYVKLATDTGMTNTQFWGTRPAEDTNGLQLGDFNGDGRTDLAYFALSKLAMDTRLSNGSLFDDDDFSFGSALNKQLFTGEFGD